MKDKTRYTSSLSVPAEGGSVTWFRAVNLNVAVHHGGLEVIGTAVALDNVVFT